MKTDLPIVTIRRPRCPRCRSVDLHTRRTAGDQGDGSILRYVRCRQCGESFKVVVE